MTEGGILFDTGMAQRASSAAALASTNAAVTDISTGLAQVQATQAGQSNSGQSFHVSMADYGTSIPSVFTKVADTGLGAVVNNGSALEWNGAGHGVELYQYNAGQLDTEQFEVSLVVPRGVAQYFGFSFENWIDIVGRMNAAGTSMCIARISYNAVRFGYVRAGISTLASPEWLALAVPLTKAYGLLTFRGGTPGDDRYFQLLVDNQVKATQDESGTTSLVGSSNRKVGFSMAGESTDIGYLVGNISSFSAADNAPAPVVGVGGKIYRANTAATASAGATGGTEYNLPTSTFDTVDNLSEHFNIIGIGIGEIECLRRGRFFVEMRAQASAPLKASTTSTTAASTVTPFLKVKPVGGSYAVVKRGIPSVATSDGFGTFVGTDALFSSWEIVLNAGDRFIVGQTPSRDMGSTGALIGDATGTKTYLSFGLLNWNTI